MLWVFVFLIFILVTFYTIGNRSIKLKSHPFISKFLRSGINTRELNVTIENGKDVILPIGYYYNWMVMDENIENNPLIDIPVPLPTFYTSEDGIRLIDKFAFDAEKSSSYLKPYDTNSQNSSMTYQIKDTLNEVIRSLITTDLSEEIDYISFQNVKSNIIRVKLVYKTNLHSLLIAFKQLNSKVDNPRKAAANIGYFSNQISYNGFTYDIIQRYFKKNIVWRPHKNIPSSWYPLITNAVSYWNKFLSVHGYDISFDSIPWNENIADPSVDLICLCNTESYIGVGTSNSDLRNGEIHWSRVYISDNGIRKNISIFNGTDENYNTMVQFALTHEIGHTLGLRHNFMAVSDNNSSFMNYFPFWYPNDIGEITFSNIKISEKYDELAIEYGYSKVENEVINEIPKVLLEKINNAKLLFHTDENIDIDKEIVKVNRFTMKEGLTDAIVWLNSWQKTRGTLYSDPDTYIKDTRKVFFFINNILDSVVKSVAYYQGYDTDFKRNKLFFKDESKVVSEQLIEFLTGNTFRLEDIEDKLINVSVNYETGELEVEERPYQGSYAIDRPPIYSIHLFASIAIADSVFNSIKVNKYKNPEKVLLSVLNTKGVNTRRTLLEGVKLGDIYHINAIGAIVGIIDAYKEQYNPIVKVLYEKIMDQTLSLLGVDNRQIILETVEKHRSLTRSIQNKKKRRGCGKVY